MSQDLRKKAESIFITSLPVTEKIRSPRAVAFTILGLYYYWRSHPDIADKIRLRADYLASLYNKESSENWQWFETYLTYSNSKLPEALLCAYLATKQERYLEIAKSTLDFLMSATFENTRFAPIGHDGWYVKQGKRAHFDQQPIDTASTIRTLLLANRITHDDEYLKNAITAFEWFLGNNVLNQMVYDESTGGCHDGIGEASINLNRGAESTISYLLARLALKKYEKKHSGIVETSFTPDDF